MSLAKVLIALCCALTPMMAARAAPPVHAEGDRTLAPYFAVTGAAPGVDALPLKSTRVDIRVAGVIADVRVRQIYRNEGETPLEARYLFPASTRAAVHAMRMRVGERVVVAEIREKKTARVAYETARQEGRSASLLEQHRANVLQMSVANVLPGDEIEIDLGYTELVVPVDGVYRYVHPAVVGPRYNGAAGSESHRAETWVAQPTLRADVPARHSMAIAAEVESPVPVQELASPTHRAEPQGVGSRRARIELPAAAEHADRDFVLEYRLAGRDIASGVLLHEGDGENHFLALIEPPARAASGAIVPREYVFVLDVSGSMHGFPLATAKTLLRSLVSNLRPTDTFNIIPFAGGHSLLAPRSLPATRENIEAALAFINAQQGRGSTELLAALRRALALPAEVDRARSFVIVTDGYVTVEKAAFDLVRDNLGDANVFAFGIGSSVNRLLVEGLARAGRGESFIVLDREQAAIEAERFRSYIEAPLLTRIRIDFRGFDVYDVDPPQVPDLFARRPIVVSGKFRGKPGGAIEIHGFTSTGAYSTSIDVAASVLQDGQSKALAHLWARNRIATLGDYRQLTHDSTAATEITALGLKYGLLTDYTSFVAVDQVIRNAGGQGVSVDQPQPLPAGVSEFAVGAVPSTPEPEFMSLVIAGGGLAWWLRRRQRMKAA
jgi:Ca-activated chloride channel homolog